MTDYSSYALSMREKRQYYFIVSFILACLGFLFYRSIVMSLICAFGSKALEKYYISYLAASRREQLLEGFRDVLYSLASSVAAGRQMPSALMEAEKEIRVAYGNEADITLEISRINSVYSGAHGDASELLLDFAQRSCLEEIMQFAKAYEICRKSGANLEDVCLKTCNLLLDKIGFLKEIKSLMAQKKLDIIMLVSLPLCILLFLNLISPSYVEVLYTTLEGRLIMTASLSGMGGALWLSLKIIDIKL